MDTNGHESTIRPTAPPGEIEQEETEDTEDFVVGIFEEIQGAEVERWLLQMSIAPERLAKLKDPWW